MSADSRTSPFVPLPSRGGELLCLLGPRADEAALAVEPLAKLDAPLSVIQSCIGGVCGAERQLVQPVEVVLVPDPTASPPGQSVPATAMLAGYRALPELQAQMPTAPGGELLRAAFAGGLPAGPLLYCRKRHCLFVARSPNTAAMLTAAAASSAPVDAKAGAGGLLAELLVWDGPAEGRPAAIYGGRGGTSALGPVASLEQLVLDQGKVVCLYAELAARDPELQRRVAAEHTCCTCSERERCFPAGSGYAYAADRLVVVHAAGAPPVLWPLGEWRLHEAARMLGGCAASEMAAEGGTGGEGLNDWRRQRAEAIGAGRPGLLLSGEAGGRELAEIARLKLTLIVDVLEQLDHAWRARALPHLCWNDDTVRVMWTPPAPVPASAWGFRALLRKIGLQPASPMSGADGAPLPYPPTFSAPALLPLEASEALRHFGVARGVNVFVKSSTVEKGGGARIAVLLEELGIPRELFCPADVIHVSGEGWQATLAPNAEHNPDDGAGLGATGTAGGDVGRLKPDQLLEACECRWYPRFGEAVDLYAVGVLLLTVLLDCDERASERLCEALAAERKALKQALAAVPIEQRDGLGTSWIAARCESDAPAALWSRRNLLYRRAGRASAALDGLPLTLWQAVMGVGLRLIAAVPGFGYCPDRTARAPRTAAGQLLPLVELRGLVALLDDLVLGRRAPAEALRLALREGE